MLWILLARGLSVLSILFQLRIFATYFPANETSRIYFLLALLGGCSLVCCALPNYLAVHSTFDQVENRIKIHRKIFFLLSVSSFGLIFALSILFSFFKIKFNTVELIFIGLLVVSSNIPTLVSNQLFALNFLKIGAFVTAINVFLSQFIAILVAQWDPVASSWFAGLIIGHTIASIFAIYLLKSRGYLKDFEVIDTPKITSKLILSILFSLSFGWLIPNLPRLLLPSLPNDQEIVVILLYTSLTYSVVNTSELIWTQFRRSFWLKYNGILNIAIFINKITREFFYFLLIFLCGFFLYLCLSGYAFNIISGLKLSLPHYLLIFIIAYEFLRGIISLSYSLLETTRMQYKFSIVLSISALCVGLSFYFGIRKGIEYSYAYSVIVLVVTYIVIATMVCLSKFWIKAV